MSNPQAAEGTGPVRRLLVICHGFPPYYGGAEHVAYFLARAAANTGRYRVTVLTSDIGGRLPAHETMEGLSVIRVPARKKQWSRHTVVELLSFLGAARQAVPALVADAQPDHVLAHFTLPAGAVARFINRKYGVPYSVVLHGSDVPGYQVQRFGWLYRFTRWWCRAVWARAQHVIAVGAPLKALALETWPEGTIDVIGNGVDVTRFQAADRSATRLAAATKEMVVVAQLIERKGIQFLFQALATMPPDDRAGWRVALYGAGPYEATLKAQVHALGLSAQVAFKGLAAHDDIPQILQQADLYLLPSLQEGLPLSLLEAMAAGCPIIATRVGGIPDVIEDGRHGLLVPPADVEALKDALLRMNASVADAIRMGEAARERVHAFDWSHVWSAYESTLYGA